MLNAIREYCFAPHPQKQYLYAIIIKLVLLNCHEPFQLHNVHISIFSETVILRCPSRTLLYKRKPVGGLSVETQLEAECHFLLLNSQRVFH